MERRVVSVNVGAVRALDQDGRVVETAIWKSPVDGRVAVNGVNLDGDDQGDRRVHGGVDKAVYAYSSEDYAWWESEGHRDATVEFAPGTFGENLTTSGIDLGASRIGDRWRVGTAVLEVSQPRQPCFKLGIRMDDAEFPGRFERAARPGAYLRIVEPGDVGAGDRIEIVPAEEPAVPIVALVVEPIDRDVLRLVAADPRAPDGWRHHAERLLAR